MKNTNNLLTEELINKILGELEFIKSKIQVPQIWGGWVQRKFVMEFLSYGDTQMAELEKEEGLDTTTVGRRKFFRLTSIINLLEKNKNK